MLPHLKKWYDSFLSTLEAQGIDLNNPYSLGFVNILDDLKNERPDALEKVDEIKSQIKKINSMAKYAFAERSALGTYILPKSKDEDLADWLQNAMKDPRTLPEEKVKELYNMAQQGRLLLYSRDFESEVTRPAQYFRVKEDGTCSISGPLFETGATSFESDVNVLKEAGFSEGEANKIAEQRALHKSFIKDKNDGNVEGLESCLSDKANNPGYTKEQFNKDLKEGFETNSEQLIMTVGHKHPEWMQDPEKKAEIARFASYAVIPNYLQTKEDRAILKETPAASKEGDAAINWFVKKFNPNKDENGKRIITQNFDQILGQINVTGLDGKVYDTKDSFKFLNDMMKDLAMGGAVNIQSKDERIKAEALVFDSKEGLLTGVNMKAYGDRMNYIGERFNNFAKGTTNPKAREISEIFTQIMADSKKQKREHNTATLVKSIYTGKQLLDKVEKYRNELSQKKILTKEEQGQLVMLSRYSQTVEMIDQKAYKPEDKMTDLLAAKLTEALALDFIRNPRVIDFMDGSTEASLVFGNLLLTNPYSMKEFRSMLKESAAFKVMVTGQSQQTLNKLLHTSNEKLAKAYIALETEPQRAKSERAKFAPTLQDTTYGGIDISAETKADLEKNAISEFLNIKEEGGVFHASYKYPDKALVNGKEIEIRKNINLLCKAMAQKSFSPEGLVAPFEGLRFTDELIDNNITSETRKANNLADKLGIDPADRESFVDFSKAYFERVENIIISYETELGKLSDFQRVIDYSKAINHQDADIEKYIKDSYQDFQRVLKDFEKMRDMDPSKETEILNYMECNTSSYMMQEFSEGVSNYAVSKGKDPIVLDAGHLTLKTPEKDPVHHTVKAFDEHHCFAAKYIDSKGKEKIISLETTAPPSGKLFFRKEGGRSAVGIYDSAKDLQAFHEKHNSAELADEAKFAGCVNASDNKTISDIVPRPGSVYGSYEMSIQCRQDLRATSHTYESLKKRLASSDVDSSWVRSKTQFRKAKETFEKLGNVKSEKERDELMAKLQSDAKAYLDYKDPKGDLQKQKDLSQYAKNRIAFMQDVYEFTNAQINRKRDALELNAERVINLVVDTLKTQGSKAQRDYFSRIMENPEAYNHFKELTQNDATFKALTKNKSVIELEGLTAMNEKAFYAKYNAIHDSIPELQETKNLFKIPVEQLDPLVK